MTGDELDDFMRCANDEIMRVLEKHIDTEAGLRAVLAAAGIPDPDPVVEVFTEPPSHGGPGTTRT